MKHRTYNDANHRYTSISSVLDKFLNDSLNVADKGFNPAVDIFEEKDSYGIHMAVPGVRKEDFKIDLVDGKLTVSGERKMGEKKETKKFHSIETQYGSFSRSFYLPEDANDQLIEASYSEGVLSISIPKAEKKVKQSVIEVK